MPVYEYRCENGHEFEVLQRMSDPAATECTVCGAGIQRIFRPPAIHFKGSGFYNTDYGRRKRGGESDGAGAGSSEGGGGESKTEKTSDKKDGSSSGSGSGSSGSSDSGSSKKSETAA